MIKVIIESPYAGETVKETQQNVDYARACMRDSLMRGEAPFASHLLYTQPGVLDDNKPTERRMGIEAGLYWGQLANVTAVYVDRGITKGMRQGIERAQKERRVIVERSIVEKEKK